MLKPNETVQAFSERLITKTEFEKILENILNGDSTRLFHVHGSLKSFIAAGLRSKLPEKPIVVTVASVFFDQFRNDLLEFYPDLLIYDEQPSRTLYELCHNPNRIVLTSIPFALTKTISKKDALTKVIKLSVNEEISYDACLSQLREAGFIQKEFVEHEGEFAVRGGIVDVFSYGETKPVRIEFMCDTIIALRFFDVSMQLSSTQIQSVSIIPLFLLSENETGSTILEYLKADTLFITEFDPDGESQAKEVEQACKRFININFWNTHVDSTDVLFRTLNFKSSPTKSYHADFATLAEDLDAYRIAYFVLPTQKDFDEDIRFIQKNHPISSEVHWIKGNIFEGFYLQEDRIAVLSKYEIAGKLHYRSAKGGRAKRRQISLREMRGMSVGDYLVHDDHGIGRFLGLEKIKVAESTQECVVLEYYGGQKLFVGVQHIHLLSKYASADASTSLSKLGTTKWTNDKLKAKKKLKDIARKLILLYAKRTTLKSPILNEGMLQKEFEASFIFDETPDQLSAIKAIYKNLESGYPMDRLVCGDAGFGKTEIAMRAACRAVESQTQVAILAPTTILAHQHFKTFKQRFANFPINIQVISRFINKKTLRTIIQGVNEGKVDIVIGTHRMLTGSLTFKQLSLLVIDEEQRFGVETKEKLREMFPTVHTLMLSATPIPRTLQLSLVGARELSIISTPPKNRQVIETRVFEFSENILNDAISFELRRQGQVFFLHNRIGSIDDIFNLLKKLFPTARIGTAHGQMPTESIEDVMLDFIEREIDILISTTIIGLGVDISNANTIIINRADMFGLSELYQLRGRVGRSDRKAFCYLITPPEKYLTQHALARLSAVESLNELGSGFNIALHDLDLRGAGDIFGSEQSGFVTQFGFETYHKILNDAVNELKLTEFTNLFTETNNGIQKIPSLTHTCDILVFFDALIPNYYVESQRERFNLYARFAKVKSRLDVYAIEEELKDRFGEIPKETNNLIFLTELKLIGSELLFSRIEITQKHICISLPHFQTFYQSESFNSILEALKSEKLAPYSPKLRNTTKFAIIAPALITGAFAERVRFSSYLIFLCLFSIFVYAPIAHWTWHPEGFLFKLGVLDFAGGTVVHISAGCAALASAIFLKARVKNGNGNHEPANIPYVILGTGLLWFGWFGFNAGSSFGANMLSVNAFATTNTASASAALAWIFFDSLKGKKASTLGLCIGAVVGLVAITPAAGFVSISSSIFIGTFSSIVSNWVTEFRTKKTLIDDTLDVFPCHGVGGIMGMLFTGVFASTAINSAVVEQGLAFGETNLFLKHLTALLFIILYAFIVSYLMLKITDIISPLRVTIDEEKEGLDKSQHGESIAS
ncbi:hypothetical protein CHS0354_000722 [Potamilus streckersoni]|uniref:Transcription-repair-coupling factor n=1 Tax=Potamilus streckersoni TaxID=2493646 RepID=A0AAE0W867_9BIVA|nr:hypothetical protein CHS0354_000722 [Potamilus streckersoni]